LDDPFDDPPQLAELIPESSPELRPPEEVSILVHEVLRVSFY
jgi:peptidyl-prolyl cis-trans isomerase-like 4